MSEITFKMELCDWVDSEIREYILSLKGIIDVNIDDKKMEFYVKYDSSLTSIRLIDMEINLFLDSKFPNLIGFDKHPKNKTLKYNMVIKDLCCEFCMQRLFYDLLLIDGIESVTSDFDFKEYNT